MFPPNQNGLGHLIYQAQQHYNILPNQNPQGLAGIFGGIGGTQAPWAVQQTPFRPMQASAESVSDRQPNESQDQYEDRSLAGGDLEQRPNETDDEYYERVLAGGPNDPSTHTAEAGIGDIEERKARLDEYASKRMQLSNDLYYNRISRVEYEERVAALDKEYKQGESNGSR